VAQHKIHLKFNVILKKRALPFQKKLHKFQNVVIYQLPRLASGSGKKAMRSWGANRASIE